MERPEKQGQLHTTGYKYATGVDLVEYTIKAAVGELQRFEKPEPRYWSCYAVHL